MASTYQLSTSGDLQLNMSNLKLNNPLGLAYGGLGADASVSGNLGSIQSSLGLAIGTNVQAYNANLNEFATLTKGSTGQFLGISSAGAYEYANPNTYTASSGLSLTGSSFSVVVDGSTVDVNGSNQIEVKALPNNSVTASAIASSAVSTGLTGGAGTALTVDNSVVAFLSGSQTVSGIKTFTAQPLFQANFSQQNSSDVGYSRQIQAVEFKSAGSGSAQNAVTIASDTGSVMVAEGYFVCVDSTLAHVAQWDFSIVFTNNSGTVTVQQANISSVYKSDSGLDLVASVSSTDVVLQLTDLSSSPMRCDCNYRIIGAPAYN
jgi:hypothetical protein